MDPARMTGPELVTAYGEAVAGMVEARHRLALAFTEMEQAQRKLDLLPTAGVPQYRRDVLAGRAQMAAGAYEHQKRRLRDLEDRAQRLQAFLSGLLVGHVPEGAVELDGRVCRVYGRYGESYLDSDITLQLTDGRVIWGEAYRVGCTPPGLPDRATYKLRILDRTVSDAIYVYDAGGLHPAEAWEACQDALAAPEAGATANHPAEAETRASGA